MHFDEPGKLMKKTRILLLKDERTLLEMYRDTAIPYFWLKKFAAEGFKNPSVNRVQFLYEYLSGQKLL